jgi:hypothetical protein
LLVSIINTIAIAVAIAVVLGQPFLLYSCWQLDSIINTIAIAVSIAVVLGLLFSISLPFAGIHIHIRQC